jgi:hypothetical protein
MVEQARRHIPLSEFSEEEEDEALAEIAREAIAEHAASGEPPMTFNEFLISVGEQPEPDGDDEGPIAETPA